MLNALTIQGIITSNGVDSQTTSGGMALAKFSIMYSEKYGGEWKNFFFKCTAFGKTAEMINEYFGPKKAITIEGKLQQDQWEDKDGNKRSDVSVIVNRVHFNVRDKDEDSSEPESKQAKKEPAKKAKTDSGDVPF